MDFPIQPDGSFPVPPSPDLFPLEDHICTPVSDHQKASSKFEFVSSTCSHTVKSTTTTKKRTRRACTIDGCNNRVVQGGLCI